MYIRMRVWLVCVYTYIHTQIDTNVEILHYTVFLGVEQGLYRIVLEIV